MRMPIALSTLAFVCASLFASYCPAADGWRAGAAKAAITPTQPMWMAGYASRKRPAEGKATDLWAKALVLEDAQKNRGVVVTLDLVGIDRELARPLRQKIADKLGLKLGQVMVCTSHTHSGPVVAKNLRPMHYLVLDESQRKQVDEYAQTLEQTVLRVVDEALQRLTPAKVSQASGTCTVAVNRRNNKEPEVVADQDRSTLQGPSDYDVPVLAVHDADGKLIAVAFGYACHATVLDGFVWSGDYPAYAQMALEERYPGATALFWAGCGGDQNPLPRRKQEYAEKYGKQLADSVQQAIQAGTKPIEPRLEATYEEIELPLGRLPTRDELVNQSRDTNIYVANRAKHLLQQLDAGKPLAQSYPYPIGVWKLGDEIDWTFLGGEVVVDYALRLKAEGRDKRTWVAAYSNDVMAYIPSRRVLAEGGYEGGGSMVYYGLPTIWDEKVEATIVDAAARLKAQLWKAKP